MKVKHIGREASCDLVLEHSTVSRQHARLELVDDGTVWVTDTDSRNGTFLQRNKQWIRLLKVSLCVGDRLRFGDCEVPLQQLTSVFGNRAGIKLGAQHFTLRQGSPTHRKVTGWDEPGPALHKPKRNPLTGQLEEDRL